MKIRGKTVFVYDVEVFPNLFTCCVANSESKNKRTYEISDRKNELVDIARLFLNKHILLCGYNNKHYDDPIINYILLNFNDLIKKPVWEITDEIKKFSDTIINTKTKGKVSWSKYKYANLFPSMDLLTMMLSEKLRVSLKVMQVTMGFHNVQEYDGDFDSMVPKDKIDEVIAYNNNDVDSTMRLLELNKDRIDIRLNMEDRYHVDVLSKDDVNMGMEILKQRYIEDTGIPWQTLKNLRSPTEEVCMNDIIFDFIKYDTPILQEFLSDLKGRCLNPNDKFERIFQFGGTVYTFGLGGIHSQQKPEIFEDPNKILEDVDVTSMYPSIILEHNVYPKHLGEEFLNTYRGIYNDRVKAKAEGNKPVNEGLKKALNGLSGNLQSEFSWVYDPECALKIRVNGQLMILMLAEKLAAIGVRIINANTDGLFLELDKNLEDKVKEICDSWTKTTKLRLEADYFERFYQYAVNDYIGVKKGWSNTHDPKLIKTKGRLSNTIELSKGMPPVIIAEAIQKYFIERIPVETTLKSCTDIKKFLTFQKVGKQFDVLYGNDPVRHINRYYMSTNGYKLIKCDKTTKEKTDICADSGVTLFNVLEDVNVKDAHINYLYYRKQIYNYIYSLEDTLPTLF